MPKTAAEIQADESAAVKGGPGVAVGAPASAPSPSSAAAQKIKVGDEEIDLADLPALIQGLRDDVAEAKSVKQTAGDKMQVAKPEAPYDYATGIFTEPAVAIDRLRTEIKAELREEYTQKESNKVWWDGFYAENKDLKEIDYFVESILNKNWASLKDMSAEKAKSKLAELTKTAISKMSKDKGSDQKSPNRTLIEGGSAPENKIVADDDKKEVPSSLSSVITARQAAKRKAATH